MTKVIIEDAQMSIPKEEARSYWLETRHILKTVFGIKHSLAVKMCKAERAYAMSLKGMASNCYFNADPWHIASHLNDCIPDKDKKKENIGLTELDFWNRYKEMEDE